MTGAVQYRIQYFINMRNIVEYGEILRNSMENYCFVSTAHVCVNSSQQHGCEVPPQKRVPCPPTARPSQQGAGLS